MAAFPADAGQYRARFSRRGGRPRRIFAAGVGRHDPGAGTAADVAGSRKPLDVKNRRERDGYENAIGYLNAW